MKIIAFCLIIATLAGCASAPALPSEAELPVQAIITRAVCELRDAFVELKEVKDFHAIEWAISITLTPKSDDELSARVGYLGKSTINPLIHTYTTWTLGTSPGAEYDVKGHRDASVAFLIHSSQLLDTRKYPVRCSNLRSDAALMQRLGIYEWLKRLVVTDENGLDKLTRLDKPSYNSQIIIKYDAGAAGPSFVGPYATISPTLYGSISQDETLAIAMTPDPTKKKIVTLPADASAITKATFGFAEPSSFSQAVRDRLDRIHTDAILNNLSIKAQ